MNGMSDNVYAHDSGVATDLFAAGDGNLFQRVMQMRAGDQGRDNQSEASTVLSSNEEPMSLFKTVRPNIVQSIRAFRVQDLADEANQLGQHFLYAYCANAQSKQEVMSAPNPQLQAAWMQLVKQVMANTEDVGERFADEARKIHYGETEERGIRGQASPDETQALLEEGIGVLPLPIPKALKEPLQ